MKTKARIAIVMLAAFGSAALAAPKKGKKKTTTPAKTEKKDEGSDAGSGSGSATTEAVTTSPDPAATGGGGGAGSGSSGMGGAGMGSGSAAEPEKTDKKDEKEPDVDSLRQEYLSLRDELFKSRARANAVASQLYSTRIQIKFNWTTGRYYGVSKASVRLDGATVYEDAGGAIAADDGVRFDGYVAPGRHLVTFHVEASGKDDDSFTSSTESQVVVKAVANKDLIVTAKGHDNGDIAYEWKKSEHGNYGLGIDVSVKTAKPAAADAAPAKGKK
ncbi:MAG: hypothetical protein QM831_45595 [Kofleriaceae bacterium]